MTREYMISKGVEQKNREVAELILLDTLDGYISPLKTFKDIYGGNSQDMQKIFAGFIEQIIVPILSSGNKVRHLGDITQMDIYKKQQEAQSSEFYKNFERHINKWTLPSNKEVEHFFGQYTELVMKNFQTFHDLWKTRSCDLQYTKHQLRAVVMAKAEGYDINSGKPDNYYVSVWAVHDSGEEFPYLLKGADGKLIYGLEKLNVMFDDFIPKDMQEDVLKITNKTDLVLKYLNEKNHNLKTKQGMAQSLEFLYSNKKYFGMKETIEKMMTVLDKLEIKPRNESFVEDAKWVFKDTFFEDAKWAFYKKIFLDDLAEQAYSADHLALLERKGDIDLFDNCIGRNSRELEDLRKSIKKTSKWALKSEEILARAKTHNKEYPFLERKVVEIRNYANYAARSLLIRYLAQPLSQTDHIRSTLISLNRLKDVLYTK